MSFSDNWKAEKERKKLERELERFDRVAAAPVSRGEMAGGVAKLTEHLISVALAIEALERVLVRHGILQPDEVMTELKALVAAKTAELAEPESVEAT